MSYQSQYNKGGEGVRSIDDNLSSTTIESGGGLQKISLLTYHLSDEDYFMNDRYDYVFEMLSVLSPTFVLLQGIVEEKLEMVEQNFIEMDYYVANSIWEDRLVGEVIASKYPISTSEFFSLHPRMDKIGAFIVSVDMPNGNTMLLCTFELGKGVEDIVREIRGNHLRSLFDIFPKKKYVFLSGDTGMTDREYVRIRKNFKDAWVIDGEKDQYRHSYNGQMNPDVHPKAKYRYDRIYYKLPLKEYWSQTKFGLVGLKSIFHNEEGVRPVLPADHFGVYVELEKPSRFTATRIDQQTRDNIYF